MNKGSEKNKIKSSDITDQWILSRVNQLGINVNQYLEDYNTIKACSEIRDFVTDLSTWYVKLNRDRIEEDETARGVLRYVLETTSKIIAPIIPFTAEKIYQTLNGNKNSVHLENYPKFNEKNVNKKISDEMKIVREIVSVGLRERDKVQIGLKWPLGKAEIVCEEKLNKSTEEIIKSQLNIKELKFVKGKEISVKLDTTQNPELEAEGYAREMSRQVQAFRKELGLKKDDEVELSIFSDEELKGMLNNWKKYLMERTNSTKIEIFSANVTTDKERFKNKIEFKIKDKRGEIAIIKK